MKFRHLCYGKEEEIFAIYTKFGIQVEAKKAIGRKLKLKELKYLETKMETEIISLIIKIDSSGIGNEKIRRGDEETQYQEDLERSSRGSY